MNAALKYSDVFVRVPLGCDMSRLVSLVKSMGGMTISIPEVGEEKRAASVDEIFGVWGDEEFPAAEEMCGFLKESRSSSKNRNEKLDAAWQ